MLDTVKLQSPYLPEELACAIEAQLIRRRAVDCPTGELLYEFVSGPLAGSYDHRVSLSVRRQEWVSVVAPKRQNPDWTPGSSRKKWITPVDTYQADCEPYLLLEGSVHKAMLGHNIEGGPTDVQAAIRWFVGDVANRLGVELPTADSWLVRGIDWAEVFDLGLDAGLEYIQGLNQATYPRREVQRFPTSLMAPGRTTTAKVYLKGAEFLKNDAKRFRKAGHEALAQELASRAHDLMRLEVAVKARKLDEDFNGTPRVDQLSETYLTAVYDREIGRLLREGAHSMETVRTAKAVRQRLGEVYTARVASSLFSTWVQFSALGEDESRKDMKRATFYLHRKQLQDAGVSWHGADVAIVNRTSRIPAGFSPVRRDARRLTSVDPRVVTLLAPYREMAAD
jgi:II/X family phage/plasmid replication protein